MVYIATCPVCGQNYQSEKQIANVPCPNCPAKGPRGTLNSKLEKSFMMPGFDIDRMFSPLSIIKDNASNADELMVAAREFAEAISRLCPDCREKGQALLSAKQAVMWGLDALFQVYGMTDDDYAKFIEGEKNATPPIPVVPTESVSPSTDESQG